MVLGNNANNASSRRDALAGAAADAACTTMTAATDAQAASPCLARGLGGVEGLVRGVEGLVHHHSSVVSRSEQKHDGVEEDSPEDNRSSSTVISYLRPAQLT